MLLLMTLAALSVHDFKGNDDRLAHVGGELSEVKAVFQMREVAYHRALILYRMLEIKDPFVRNEEYNRFRMLADRYFEARNKLLQKNVNKNESEIWQRLTNYITRNSEIQNKVAELILDDKIDQARSLMVDEVITAQDQAMNQLALLFDTKRASAENSLAHVRKKNKISLMALSLLAAVAAILGLLVAFIVAQRINRTETTLVSQSDRIWRLYELTANPRLTTGEQVMATLELGCEMFGMKVGTVCDIDEEAGTSTFTHVVASEKAKIKDGTVLDLDLTFCSIVYRENQPVAIHHVARSPYSDYPCYEFARIEAYIATPIYVNGVRYGTVNFSSRSPRFIPFSKVDMDLMNLIGSWISVAIERELIKDDMQRARETAESASQAKSNFLANMSHEIRTPLTAILGYSESLLDSFQTSEERDHAVQAILRSGEHLQQIINDILDLSKIEAQQLEIELLDVPLFQLMADIELVAGSRAREKGLAFSINYHFPVPSLISTDPTRLKQILINLCSNAVKFTEKGHVTVNISYLPQTRKLQFVVSDTGIGISPEQVSRLFIAFSQADVSTTRKYGGTGLGLCISQQLANRLGGQVVCNSVINQGSQFTVTIDAGANAGSRLVNVADYVGDRQTQNQVYQPLSFNGHILLAEDSEDNQRLISMYICRTGAEVTVADNGRIAVDLALAHDYDLILMDMQMPIMDGMEATRCLRKAGCDTPVVALTANAMKSDREKYMEAGVDDYLTKPLDLDHFYEVITGYLRPKQESGEDGALAQAGAAAEGIRDSADYLCSFAEDEEYKELLRQFVKMLPDIVDQISSAAEEQDWETLQIVSHRLKGSGGSYGFPQLTELAKKINDATKAAYFDHIDKSVAELNALTQGILDAHGKRKLS